MPKKSTLGPNINPPASGMMAALGLAPQSAAPAPAEAAPEAATPDPRPPQRPRSRATTSPPKPPPLVLPRQEPTSSPGPVARVPTDISRETLDLARRGAYWNRETLRAFLERAIDAEAARVADKLELDELPGAPALKTGRPLRP
jgi:hypothetical protein